MTTSGVVMGILGLFRGNFYLALPLLIAWPLVRWAWNRRQGIAVSTLKHSASRALCFTLGFMAIVLLITARNKIVADQWVYSSAGSGAVLYIGNNPHSPTGEYVHLPFLRPHPRFEEADMQAEAERRTGRILSTKEVSQFWRDAAIQYTLEHKKDAVLRALYKLRWTFESYELGDNYSLSFHGLFSPLVGSSIPWWAIILSLSCGWLIMAREERLKVVPLLILLFAYVASLLIFFVRSRYRIPLAPLMMILASLEVALIYEVYQKQKTRLFTCHLVSILVAISISLGFGIPRVHNERLGMFWMSLGIAHLNEEDIVGARQLLKEATRQEPNHAIIWMTLGKLELGQKRYKEAAQACAKAVELNNIRRDMRECLAMAFNQLGDHKQAWEVFEPVVSSTMPLVHFNLVTSILNGLGRHKDAVALLKQGEQKHMTASSFHYYLARSYWHYDKGGAKSALQNAIKHAKTEEEKRFYSGLHSKLSSNLPAPQSP